MLDAKVILTHPQEIIQSLIGKVVTIHHTTFKKKDSCQRIKCIDAIHTDSLPPFHGWRLDCVGGADHYFLTNPQLLLLVNNLLVKRVIETDQFAPPIKESHVSLRLR